MANLNKVLTYLNDLIQIVRHKKNNLEYILKIEIKRKIIQIFCKQCDNHLHKTNIFNKIEVFQTKDFDLITEDMFDELPFEIILDELVIDEGIDGIQNYFVNISEKFDRFHGPFRL